MRKYQQPTPVCWPRNRTLGAGCLVLGSKLLKYGVVSQPDSFDLTDNLDKQGDSDMDFTGSRSPDALHFLITCGSGTNSTGGLNSKAATKNPTRVRIGKSHNTWE
ncbi:hypothetical protein E5D57_003834 [Metarhizium anisopliae]|nr:hypothetical protein E5D57_003834 [Metarhizium anisopliae]